MHPVLFSIDRQVIYTYSVVLGLTAGLGLLWLGWSGRRAGDGRLDAALWALLAAVVGGRVGHVLVNWEYYAEQPREALALTGAGLSFHAGLLAAVVTLVLYARWTAKPPQRTVDRVLQLAWAVAPVLLLGVAGGWLACLLGGCAYGRAVPPPQRFFTPDWPDLYGVHAFRLPSQLLGLLLAVLLLVALVLAARRRPRQRACITGLLLALYALGDFLIAFTRGDLQLAWGPLQAVQWADLVLLAAGLALWSACRRAQATDALLPQRR